MREILFRGKTKDEANEWIESCNINKQFDMYGKEHIYIGLHTESKLYPLQKNIYWIEVIPESVGQFTGLTDKNGKEIFEGDIVKVKTEYVDETIYLVAYRDCGFKLIYCPSNGVVNLTKNKSKNIEVIGNIHDNPELLEVQNG